MLHLRVFGSSEVIAEVAGYLHELDGSTHVIYTPGGSPGQAVVTADLAAEAVDSTLAKMQSLGIPAKDVVLLELHRIGPSAAQRPLATVIWSDLLSQAGANARPLARYLVFMAAAGVIAAFGVIYANTILIVGAMAISPDLLPITAAATALVLRRWGLVGQAVGALVIGLACACAVGAVMTAVLDGVGLLPAGLEPNQTGFLDGLATVNIATPIVALAAGIVAILGIETKASTAVGVAISSHHDSGFGAARRGRRAGQAQSGRGRPRGTGDQRRHDPRGQHPHADRAACAGAAPEPPHRFARSGHYEP